MRLRALLVFLLFVLVHAASAQMSLSGNCYTQNFDSIGKGLPKGWGVYIGASDSSTGTLINDNEHLLLKPVSWSIPYGNFRNCASANGHYFSHTDTGAQNSSKDRALAVRQVSPSSTFFPHSDPGAAFVFQIANTEGMTNFNLTFNLQSLDSISPRLTTWSVDYGIGAHPSFFTLVNATGKMTTGGNTFSNNVITVNFKNMLDNKTGPVSIRIITLKSSDGVSYRTTTGIDNFKLTWVNATNGK